MLNIGDHYDKLWQALIRPPRAQYSKKDLGPALFQKKGLKIKRTQVEIMNPREQRIIGSHYEPQNRPCKQLPCVIYLHGNSSCQIQAQQCLSSILCHDITLFAFDFSGCGISEGEYISLGFHEREDVDAVFKYLRQQNTVSSIGIWGRSMGAVTALMYADRNHEIGCLVLDSPFYNLEALCKELAKKQFKSLSVLSGLILGRLSATVKEKNNFNIAEIDPIKHVKAAYIPALFIAANNDDFILPHHTDKLHEAYSGDKQKMIVQGDHNSRREQHVLDKISTFFFYGLHVTQLVKHDQKYIDSQKSKQKEQSQQQQAEQFIDQPVFFNNYYNRNEEQEFAEALRQSLQQKDKESKS